MHSQRHEQPAPAASTGTRDTSMPPRHAEIAGAGLGGLAVSIALAQRGWSVRVHERSDTLRMFGAGIWLWENGLRSLSALGVEAEATKRAVRIETLVARDQNGRPLM